MSKKKKIFLGCDGMQYDGCDSVFVRNVGALLSDHTHHILNDGYLENSEVKVCELTQEHKLTWTYYANCQTPTCHKWEDGYDTESKRTMLYFCKIH
jgi:hypothetical protein